MLKQSVFIMTVLTILGAMPTAPVFAAKHAKSSKAAKKTKKYSTNVNFDDHLVKGQLQAADEAVTTVEDEKLLSDLLEVRKDFKDRIKASGERF